MDKRTRTQAKLIHIQGRRAEAFRQLREGIADQEILCAPLDIGKNVHWAAFHTGDGRLLHAPFEVATLKAGYERYVQTLDDLVATHHPRLVILGHEPTGVYHESWARNLLTRYADHLVGRATPRFVYQWVNSYQVKLNRTQATLSFNKTDLIDLGAIGDLLLRGLGFPARLPTDTDLLVRQEVYALRATQGEQRRVGNRIIGLFDQLIPGALLNPRRLARAHPDLDIPTPLATRPLERQLVEALITLCPNPYDILALGSQGIIDLFHDHGYRCGTQTAARILDVVQRALLPPAEVAPAFAAILKREFAHYQFLSTQRAEALAALETLLPHTRAHLLARYLTGVGNLDDVLFAGQIWRKAGMTPTLYSSGDVFIYGQMSKQGDPFFRDTLYLLGYQLALHCPYFGDAFLNAIDRGKSEAEATIHAAHKANRVFFHLLQHDEPFAPPDIADYAAFSRQWEGRMRDYLEQKKHSRQRKPRARQRPQRQSD
ncbi:MAG TPA: transposase [Anaerolineae bacterium]|nr:transposase [Anaerolineae bacterium]